MQSFNHRTDKRPRASEASNDVDSVVHEEKKIRGRNKLHRPRNGQIAIIPEGDNQFRYAQYSIDDTMKKGPILGVILKKEYPPIIEGTDRAGRPFQYHASKWSHYSHTVRDDGQTPADRVKAEFWSIYSVPEELEDEADCVFEKYAHSQCKNVLYQARPAAVKYYYREIIRSPKPDSFACGKLLTFQQYMLCMPDWFTKPAWESICTYWCSDDYLKKRRLGQYSRKKNPAGAQNRGGSRPLEAKYGPGKATIINTYCCMKSGIKNCDSSGNAGPIPERAQQLVDNYNAALQDKYPENWQEQPFDGQIAYDIGGGLSHGRLAIGDGAVKKGPIIDTAKASETRPSSSRSYQNLCRRYEVVVENNRRLTQQNAVLTRHVKRTDRILELIAQKVEIEIPPDMLEEEENDMSETGDGSSHASPNLDNNSDGH